MAAAISRCLGRVQTGGSGRGWLRGAGDVAGGNRLSSAGSSCTETASYRPLEAMVDLPAGQAWARIQGTT